MYLEQRIYTLVPGGVAEYLRHYAECGRAIQEGHLGAALGCYTREVGELNQLVYLWPFDSLDERARRRAALLADPGFAQFRGKVRQLLVRQENSLLVRAQAPASGTGVGLAPGVGEAK